MNVQKIKPTIGAIVHDIQLNHLTSSEKSTISNLLLEHEVLVFRDQKTTPKEQVEFAANFGDLHIHPIYPSVKNHPEVIILDSQQQDLKDNELWHTDVTFSQTPPLGCVLQAIKIPQTGGDTLWTSGTAAYQALPDPLKSKLKNLSAMHDIRLSFPLERYAKSEEERQKLETIFQKNQPVQHPIVRTHPVTKKPCLFVSEGFTSQINGLTKEESDELLNFLFKHSTQEEFSFRWKWQEGDIIIWDNRSTQHKALFDYGTQHRIMHRVTINGDQPY